MIASVVVLLAGSLCTALFAIYVGATSAGLEGLLPGGTMAGRLLTAALLGGAVGGVATAVGLLAGRNWARIAILVIAATLVAFGAASALVLIALPMEDLFGAEGERVRAVRNVLLLVYATPVGVGTWWLVFFTRASTVARFATGGSASRIPLPVALVAWSAILGGVLCLGLPFTGAPLPVPDGAIDGWGAALLYVALGVAQLFIGRGLLRLDETTRRAGIAFFSIATLYAIALAVWPGVPIDAVSIDWALADGGTGLPFDSRSLWWWMSGLVVAGFAIPAWLLVRWRTAFATDPSTAPPAR